MKFDYIDYISLINKSKTIIVADGDFPNNKSTLNLLLRNNIFIICCDGAIKKLDNINIRPDVIIGDFDSISKDLIVKYNNILLLNPRQDNNDLTKSIEYCSENNFSDDIVIIGATGLREDHTLANIFLLTYYKTFFKNIILLSDYGVFIPLNRPTNFKVAIGQQVSIFAIDRQTKISTIGLKYPLNENILPNLYSGTLNEAEQEEVSIITNKDILVYITNERK